jgi:hypothetical protein
MPGRRSRRSAGRGRTIEHRPEAKPGQHIGATGGAAHKFLPANRQSLRHVADTLKANIE